MDICAKRGNPLAAVLGVSPAGLMRGNVGVSAFPKADSLGGLDLLSRPEFSALADRVRRFDTMPKSQRSLRLFVSRGACFGEADEAYRSEPHIAELALVAISKN